MIKRELVKEQVQVDGSPEGFQQVCSPVQQGQGEGYLPAAQPQTLAHGQQPQGVGTEHIQQQNQTVQGGMALNMKSQQVDKGREALEVTVQVRLQKLGEGWEAPEMTVQVQPQKLSPRWEMPDVTVQLQLEQQGKGTALPQVTLQVQPKVQERGMTDLKVTVQMHFGCEPKEVSCMRDQGEEILENGEQQTLNENQGESVARSEGKRELAVMELVPQGAHSQKQDQEGEVLKFQHGQSQEDGREAAMEIQAENKAGLHGEVTDQLYDQNQKKEELKADLSLQQEGHRDTEMEQGQGDVQVGPKVVTEVEQEGQEREVLKKRPRETPNYFVSIPITNDQVFLICCSNKL